MVDPVDPLASFPSAPSPNLAMGRFPVHSAPPKPTMSRPGHNKIVDWWPTPWNGDVGIGPHSSARKDDDGNRILGSFHYKTPANPSGL